MIWIRKAEAQDIREISKLEREWVKENISWGIVLSTKEELKEDIKKLIFYVAEENNRIVGSIEGEVKKAEEPRSLFGIKKGQRYGEILSIYISKQYRGKSIGIMLIKKMIGEFRKRKIKIVKLKAVSKNIYTLVEYYKRLGFEERVVEMVLKPNKCF